MRRLPWSARSRSRSISSAVRPESPTCAQASTSSPVKRRSRRTTLRRRLSARRQAIVSSHALKLASPRNVDSVRNALTNASCAISSASASDPRAASAARKTAVRCRRTSSPNASVLPSRARSTSSLSSTYLVDSRRSCTVGKSRGRVASWRFTEPAGWSTMAHTTARCGKVSGASTMRDMDRGSVR